MAKDKAKDLKLKLPVYHGKAPKTETWPNVIIYDVDGKVIYNGKQNREFESILNKALKAKR